MLELKPNAARQNITAGSLISLRRFKVIKLKSPFVHELERNDCMIEYKRREAKISAEVSKYNRKLESSARRDV